MKDLLLFFQYKLAQRSKELSFTRPGDCRPGIYGCIEQTAAKKICSAACQFFLDENKILSFTKSAG